MKNLSLKDRLIRAGSRTGKHFATLTNLHESQQLPDFYPYKTKSDLEEALDALHALLSVSDHDNVACRDALDVLKKHGYIKD